MLRGRMKVSSFLGVLHLMGTARGCMESGQQPVSVPAGPRGGAEIMRTK